jgi:hypothetical protein
VAQGIFKGIILLSSRGKEKQILICKFYQALIDSIQKRLLDDNEHDLCASINVLDRKIWPNDILPEHGEMDLRHICDRFHCDFSHMKSAFRDYKDGHG